MADQRDKAEAIRKVLQRLAVGDQLEDADLMVGSTHFIRWKDAPQADDAARESLLVEMQRDGLIFFNPDNRQCELTDKARQEYDLGDA